MIEWIECDHCQKAVLHDTTKKAYEEQYYDVLTLEPHTCHCGCDECESDEDPDIAVQHRGVRYAPHQLCGPCFDEGWMVSQDDGDGSWWLTHDSSVPVPVRLKSDDKNSGGG